MNDHEDMGLGRCMVSPDEHDPAAAAIGVENDKTGERRVVLICIQCFMAHTKATIASTMFGPGVVGIINCLFGRIGVEPSVVMEMLEVAIETHPDAETTPLLREALRQMRADEVRDVTPITANDFAALMARTNTTNPRHEEIN